MLLKVLERMTLLRVLPAEDSFLTMKIVTDIRDAASFSEDEFAELEFRQEDEQLFWSTEKDVGKEIDIGPKGRSIVYDALEELDKQGKIRAEYMDLCEKFEYTGE